MTEWSIQPRNDGNASAAEVIPQPIPSQEQPQTSPKAAQDPFEPFQETDAGMGREEPPSTILQVPRQHFGQMLQTLRLNRNCSISQAAAQSHLSPNTIVALEAGEIGKLDMGMYYIASSIERLCHLYGNAPAAPVTDAFMRDYEKYSKSHGLISQRKPYFDAGQENNHPTIRLPAFLIGIVAILLLALVLGGWGYKHYQERGKEQREKEYELPRLIQPLRLPMERLPIPSATTTP